MVELTEATALRLADETTALRQVVERLSHEITDLTDRIDGNEVRAREEAKLAREEAKRAARTRIALAIIGVIVLAIAFIAWQNYRTNEDQRATAAQQESLIRDFICPSTALLVGGYRPDSRPAGDARDAYSDSIDGLRLARERLSCGDELVPPAIPASPAPNDSAPGTGG